MLNYQNQSMTGAAARTMDFRRSGEELADWSGEITPPAGRAPQPYIGDNGLGGTADVHATQFPSPPAGTQLDLKGRLPDEAIESPATVEEAYLGSLKAMLQRNVGSFIVATFLIGQNTVAWEGILYDVGNDYLVLYQVGRDRYIVCDLYSLKYTEFYDTRRRELCQQLLRENNVNS